MSQTIPWSDITPDLLARYATPAPRYTSYPTAPEWNDTFGPQQFAAALDRADQDDQSPLSLYLHLPFCRARCLYCGCASWVSQSTDEHNAYLDALAGELTQIAARLPHRRRIRQLHLGGGTPTTLSVAQLERLHGLITEHFTIDAQAEVAIEVDPVVTTGAHIDALAGLGFNRISMGVQDFNPDVQQAIGRLQSIDITRTLFDQSRRAGFGGINFDLIYGLPRQQLDRWNQTIDQVIEIGPDRLAVFGYAHVPWMRPHQKAFDAEPMPDSALRFELFRSAHDRLVDAGYVYIGMDHFARPDDELAKALADRRLWRNFQGYTVFRASDLVGLGVTAISDLCGSFAQNNPDLSLYSQAATAPRLATYRGIVTTPDDRLRRHVITQLMCNLTLSVESVGRAFAIDFWQYFQSERIDLNRLADDGLIELDEHSIAVTPAGRIFVRHVGRVFDRFIRERKSDGPRFSKTV